MKYQLYRRDSEGFNLSEIYLDPLVFPVSVDSNNGIIFLDTAEELRQKSGKEIHFAPGLSHVSYCMPNRKLLNQVFAYLCRESSWDGAIVNPVHINKDVLNGLDPESEIFKLTKAVLTGED